MAQDKLTGKGGAGRGQGRKPKAEEDKVKELHYAAMVKVFGNEEAFLAHGYKQAKESYPYYKLMHERYYGKPKETKELTHNFTDEPTFNNIKIDVLTADTDAGAED